MGSAEVPLYEGHRIRDRDGVAPADVVRARRFAGCPRRLDARPRRAQLRGHRTGLRSLSRRQPHTRRSPRQHHAHLGNQDRGFLGSSLLGEQARLLRCQGRLGSGRRERLSSRALSGTAELVRAGLSQPHLLQRSRRGQPLRGLAGAAPLHNRASCRIPVTALIEGSRKITMATSAQTTAGAATAASTSTQLGPLKRINAGLLNVGYIEAGPSAGMPVILLHGWPYDIHSYVEVAPLLASAGYRVIIPYLRGYGTTSFLSSEAFRNGQPSAPALDAIALMDALKIDSAIIAGFDWGARTADIVAAVWPQRCRAVVSVSGYLIGSQDANKKPLPPAAALQWWYQYYFATERGGLGYRQ